MKTLVRGRARLVAVVVALVVMATASSCAGGAGAGAGGQAASKPVITPKQAAAVVMHLEKRRVTALDDEDPTALESVDASPELTLDQNAIQEAKDLSTSLTATPFVSANALVPKQTTYPAWFMALVKDDQGNTLLDLCARASRDSAWQLEAETDVENGPVRWTRTPGGWALAGHLPGNPSQELSSYWNAATTGQPTVGVAPGRMTSDVASSLVSTTSSNESKGWAVAVTFSTGGSLPQAVRLQSGDALGFAWVTELLQVRAQYGPCFVQPGSNSSKWDPQVPDGNYQEVDVRYTYLEGMVESGNGDLSAVSLGEGTTGADGAQCPG